MLKRFDPIVTQFDGTPYLDGDKPLTVAKAITSALLAGFEDEKSLSGEEKLKRYILAERIFSADATPAEVTAENLTLIKACVAKAYSTGVVGFVFQHLENDSDAPKKRAATLAAVKG